MRRCLLVVILCACQPRASERYDAPSLERQCEVFAETLQTRPVPGPTDASQVSSVFAHCDETKDALLPLMLLDLQLQLSRNGIVDALEMCEERTFRSRARWTLMTELEASPERAKEEQRLLKVLDRTMVDLRFAMEPHLIELDRHCGSSTFGPRVDAERPTVTPGPAAPPHPE